MRNARDVVAIVRDLLLCVILVAAISVGIAAVKLVSDRMRPTAAPAEVVHVRVPGECGPGQVYDYRGARC